MLEGGAGDSFYLGATQGRECRADLFLHYIFSNSKRSVSRYAQLATDAAGCLPIERAESPHNSAQRIELDTLGKTRCHCFAERSPITAYVNSRVSRATR